MSSGDYDDVEDLEQKLVSYKSNFPFLELHVCAHFTMGFCFYYSDQFMEFDEDDSGDIGKSLQWSAGNLYIHTGQFDFHRSCVIYIYI